MVRAPICIFVLDVGFFGYGIDIFVQILQENGEALLTILLCESLELLTFHANESADVAGRHIPLLTSV